MKIGILIGRFPPEHIGGAEMQASKLAKHLAKEHEVFVLTRRFGNMPGCEERDGYLIFRHRSLNLPVVRVLSAFLTGVLSLVRLRHRADVLLCYQIVTSGVIGALAQKILGIPAAVWIRGETEYKRDAPLDYRLLTPFVLRTARIVLVQTERIRQSLLDEMEARCGKAFAQGIERKCFVVRNGVDLPEGIRRDGEPNGVIFAGRLYDFKGVEYLLAAARESPQWPVLIVGDGPDRERLEGLAQGQPVRFLGALPHQEVLRNVAGSKVLVLPSVKGDGLPNVLLEALSLGVPVVSTQTAGIPDVIRDGEFGFLVPPADPGAIRRAVDKILSDDALWERLSVAAAREAQRYSWDAVSAALMDVLVTAGIAGAGSAAKREVIAR